MGLCGKTIQRQNQRLQEEEQPKVRIEVSQPTK